MRVQHRKTQRKHRVPIIQQLESRCLLSGEGDIVGDTIAEASNLGILVAGGFQFEFGTIDEAGDLDVYEFQVSSSGLVSIDLGADFSVLDTVLTLRDSSGNVLAFNDDSGFGGTDSFLTFAAQAGETYFVEASGFGTSTGDFFLSLSHDIGDTPAAALDLGSLPLEGTQQFLSAIDVSGDRDVFQFQTETAGQLNVRLGADFSSLDTVVTLLDSSGNVLAVNDDFDFSSTDSFLTFSTQAGETYFVEARGFGSSTGDYLLTLALDIGDTPASSLDLGSLSSGQSLQFFGSVGSVGDRDVFRFQTDASGLTIIQLGADLSLLDTFVTLLDSSGNVLDSNDDVDFPFNSDSFLTFTAQAGETYFVEARGFGSSIGDYSLTIALDIGDTPATAFDLGLLTVGEPLQFFSAIDVAGDRDVFRFQAATDGPTTIQLTTDFFSDLDTVLRFLDSSGNVLAVNDDFLGTDSLLTFTIQGGQTYFVEASGFESSTGSYALEIAILGEDIGDTIETALNLGLLSNNQPLLASSRIDLPGDRDVFQFQTQTPGITLVRLNASNSSSLDPFVTLLDSAGNTLASNDDADFFDLNSSLTIALQGGQTYYVVASGIGSSIGRYALSLTLQSIVDLGTLTGAQPLQATGTISVPTEQDFFQFQAQTGGLATIELSNRSGSLLDTIVTVLDASGVVLASNDDIAFPSNTNSRVNVGLVAGRTYIVQASGFGTSTGDYSLIVSALPVVDLGLLRNGQPLTANGEISAAREIDRFQFQANASGLLILELNAASPGTLDPTVTLRDSSNNFLAFNDDVNVSSQRNSRLTFGVVAGQLYFVEAAGFGTSTGGYQLNLSLAADTVPDDFRDPNVPNLGVLSSTTPLQTDGAIEFSGDRDVFRFSVATSSLIAIELSSVDRGTLDTVLRVLDVAGNQVAFNDDIDFPFNTNSRVTFSVQTNQTFFIEARGFGSSTGTYTLSASVVPVQSIVTIPFPAANTPTQIAGSIGTARAISQFRVDPATSDRNLQIEVNATTGVLDPTVTVRVLSADGAVLRTLFDDDSGPGLNSLLTLSVTSGQRLEIDVRGFGVSTGAFSLIVRSADAAANNIESLDALLAESGSALLPRSISQPLERDVFRFTAASDGRVVIDLVAINRSLDPLVTVVNSTTGAVIGTNDDSPFNTGLLSNPMIAAANIPMTSLNSHLEFAVTENVTYDIIARDFSFGTGAYFLSVSQGDDFVNSFDALDSLRRTVPQHAIQLNDRQEFAPAVAGEITAPLFNQGAQDVDLLDFQANFSGVLNLTIDPDSTLNVSLSVFRDVRSLGAATGDYELISVLTRNQRTVSLPVDESGIYVVRVAGLSGAGSYRLFASNANQNNVDLESDSIANARTISLDETVASAIDFAFDRDVYRFIGPSSGGAVSVSLRQTTSSPLDPLLTILDNRGRPIASNDDVDFSAGRIDSLVTFEAMAGVEYFVQAGGLGSTTGEYSLSFATANASTGTVRSLSTNADRAFIEAATIGLVSIANGAGSTFDRNPEAIRNAVVEAIAALAKQGKLTSDYLVIILDAAPEGGFVLTDGAGRVTEVRPGEGAVQLPNGGIFNNGQFAQVVIVPTSGTAVPTLQLSGFGSGVLDLANSFQASLVTRSGSSQSLPQLETARNGSSGDKVQLSFALGFDIVPNLAAAAASQTPSFFLTTNAFSRPQTAVQERETGNASLVMANIDVENILRSPPPVNLLGSLDPEEWQRVLEGVLDSLQFEGLSRSSLETILIQLRANGNNIVSEVMKQSPVVRSAKAAYQILKQSTGWLQNTKPTAPAPKQRPSVPKVTQETPPSKAAPHLHKTATKVARLSR